MSELRVSFPNVSDAEANKLAPSLQSTLAAVGVVKTGLLKSRQDSQDVGSIVSIVLGAPAVIATVWAIGGWLSRNNQASVDIVLPNGVVVIKNMKSGDVPKAIAAVEKLFDNQ